ncbi:MAG: SDR family oxidoreductase [Bacteroidota bacterium]
MQLQGKWVWITGASSGLGEALSYEFARNGANLIISSRKQVDLERVKANCSDKVSVIVQVLDVATQQDQFEIITQKLVQQTGRIDILINNAGISQRGLVKNTDLAVDRKIMEINYFGAIALTKAVLPVMLQQGSGQFVAMSSLVGKFGSPLRSTYAASKHALHGFFDSLRAETVNEQIKVTLICPGYIHTNISQNAVTADGTAQGTTDAKTANGLTPEAFAKKAVRGIAKGKREIIIGRSETLGIYLKRFFPGIFARIISRVNVT